MTVNTTESVAEFDTNGVTTNFPFYFKFLANEDLVVIYVDPLGVSTPLTLGVHYTVNGVGSDEGGSVVTTTVLAGPGHLAVAREMDAYQLTSLRNQGKFLAEIHEDVFDRLTMLIQQGLSTFTRALTRPLGKSYFNAENRLISNVKDPEAPQDAATSGWTSRYIAALIGAIQGPINNALNIFYKAPDGSSHVVQDLSTPDAPAFLGARKIDGTATNLQVALDEIRNKVPLSEKFQAVTSSSGVMTINASVAQTHGGVINENISTLNLVGATAGKKTVIDFVFSQPVVGSQHSISVPSNVVMPVGITTILSTARQGDITLGRFSSTDGVTWFYQRLGVYQVSLPSVFPSITNENATFNDEGTSTTGWAVTNMALVSTSSNLVFTKSSGAGITSGIKAVTLPAASRDFIVYGKVKVSNSSGTVATVLLYDGSKETGIYFGSANGGDTYTAGAISMTGFTSSRTVASVATGVDFTSSFVDYALHYCATFGAITCYFRDPGDGLWYFRNRVLHTWFNPGNVYVNISSSSPTGSTVTIDFLTVARPNLIAIGDSICAGSTGFNPDPALGLSNYLSTWMHYSKLYPLLRNNLVVNKGRGGKTSAQTLAAISDVTNQSPQLVFLHASTNDPFQSITKAQRTTNIQSTVNAITAASGKTILLNSAYGAQGSSDNTTYALRDYCLDWWVNYRLTVTGLTGLIDIMQPVLDGNGYMSTTYLVADQLHPNPLGHQKIGEFIASS